MPDPMQQPSPLRLDGQPETTEPGTIQPVPQLVIDAADSFNYAAWQNAVPLLRSVTIDNTNGPGFSSLTVELKASPAFARTRRWLIDRIGAGEKLTLKDIDVDIDPDHLNRLDEAERGVLTFTLLHQDSPLHEATHVLRVLARDEWGGMSTMGELLPAFVTPNEPALATLLKAAADALERHGHDSALDGYQSRDPKRAYLLTGALWSAVCARSLVYANPPGSFEKVGQKTRRIGTILGDGLATCLDTTLLFASGLEAMGLNPVLVMTEGHCFAGVWLVEKSFKKLVEPDCSEIRKAVDAKELIVFETTLVTHRPCGGFEDALRVAKAAISVEKEHTFVAVIDVARARMSEIRPLASHAARTEDAPDGEFVPPPLPTAPDFDQLPAAEFEERPSTPAGRIERWQRKLLDLSLRNRLLNFGSPKQSVPVLCPNVSRLEDRLADGKQMRLVSLVEGNPRGQRDAELHHRRTQKDLDQEFARRALERDEIACDLEPYELESRLTALYRKVRSDLAEGGSNTLYLAVGFLRWKKTPTDQRTYRAPLLLVPVQLVRRSASSPFYLASHEDDVRFNATLLQLLKKDFDCDVTGLESNLPMDDSGVNVQQVLDRMRQAVRDIPGFEVVEDAAIAPFSFAKYLMWRDLVDRFGQLEHNRVVRHLIQNPDKPFSVEGVGPMPQPHEIDSRYTPQDIVHPLPADSSQLAAVMAASEGHDLVIVGPPGTGKSQTIANIITQCLAIGKTVLFVAEKTAALDVVYRRLREHGLGDCCVELHSNKAERRHFLDQLGASWKNRSRAEDTDWFQVCEKLKVHRDQLNAYAAAVHSPDSNGWTPYQAMGECIAGRDLDSPTPGWPENARHSREEYAELETTVSQLAHTFQAVATTANLPRVEATEWSMAWETGFLECCRQLEQAAESLSKAIQTLAAMLGVAEVTDVSAKQLSQLYRLAQELTRPALPPAEILLHVQLERLKSGLAQRQDLLTRSKQAEQALEAALHDLCKALGAPHAGVMPENKKRQLFRLAVELVRPQLPPSELVFHPNLDAVVQGLAARPALLQARSAAFDALVARKFNPALIDRIQLDSLEREWNQACSAIWPLSALRKRGVAKKLKAYMTPQATAEPDVDLSLLREYWQASAQLAENLASLNLPPALQAAVENDPTAIDADLKSAQQLRQVFVTAGYLVEQVAGASRSSLEPLVAAARRLYPPGRELESLRTKLGENLNSLGLTPAQRALVERDANALTEQIQAAVSLREAAMAFGIVGEGLSHCLQQLLATRDQTRREIAAECCQRAKSFKDAWTSYASQAGATPVSNDSVSIANDAAAQARLVLANRTSLRQWTAWTAIRQRAQRLGLAAFVEALQTGELRASDAASRFRLAYARWWLPKIVDQRQPLRAFQRFLHEGTIEEFRRLDDCARQAAAPRARQAVLHGLPPSDQVARKSELGLLRHQMSLKRPSKSIREMIAGMPGSFSKLAPCLLMSPLSIAQYLPAEHPPFDVVIFDEASQIATWDAIGAIARGKQTIIVGDPKQLPPTNFFGRTDNDDDNPELEDHEKDLESILDEVQASGLPTLQLNWHYRSRHESLIAFSNWNYYGNRLVTFPAAESIDRGVSLRHIRDGIYDRGKSRTNRREAEAIVAELVERMKRCMKKPESQRLTYGVVTFNSQQQELIQDLLDDALRQNEELEWFFSDDRIEPTVVKNLENVQGDERDVMMFSVTFGFDAAGKFPVDFGAINRDGGERRLNVAITRARQELVVFASFLPEQIRVEKSKARGVHDLRAFLEYADKGPEAIIARIEGSLGGPESPLEEAIAASLTARGWRVDTQVGVSGFRIDLGVVHPDKPGAYLAGVECDGATYHRSPVARDRDKIRQQVLENLGWTILRVWSTDWWYDPVTAIEQLDSTLNRLLETSREKAVAPEVASDEATTFAPTPEPEATCEMEEPGPAAEDAKDPSADYREWNDPEVEAETVTREPLFARQTPATHRRLYVRATLGDASSNQERFFEADYSDTLRGMAHAVLAAQGPIRVDALVREVARAHGFLRTSTRMKQRVLELLPDVTSTVESVGVFLWPGDEAPESIPFRYHATDENRRSLDEIAMPELVGLVREYPELASSPDPALYLAEKLGLARLSSIARARLEEAISASGLDGL